MAVIQVEPGSKTVTGRLVDGTLMTSSATVRRINGATHVVQKPYQNLRLEFPGDTTSYTFIGNSQSRNIALPSGTTLVYRSK